MHIVSTQKQFDSWKGSLVSIFSFSSTSVQFLNDYQHYSAKDHVNLNSGKFSKESLTTSYLGNKHVSSLMGIEPVGSESFWTRTQLINPLQISTL
jgi:hypothetical protein